MGQSLERRVKGMQAGVSFPRLVAEPLVLCTGVPTLADQGDDLPE